MRSSAPDLRLVAVSEAPAATPAAPMDGTHAVDVLSPGLGGIRSALPQALAEWMDALRAYAQCLRAPSPRSPLRATYEARQKRCAGFASSTMLAEALESLVAVMLRIRAGKQGAVSDEIFLAAKVRLQWAREAYLSLRERARDLEHAEEISRAMAQAVASHEGHQPVKTR